MRLFIAVWPPDDVVEVIAGAPRPDAVGVRWTTPDQWHVTLRFLGEVESSEPVLATLEGVTPGPAVARMGPASTLLNPRVIAVPVAGLGDVADAVITATAAIGRPPERRPFRGHVTLARLHGLSRAAGRRLAGVPLVAEWLVPEVHVVRSHLSPKGARYETVAVAGL